MTRRLSIDQILPDGTHRHDELAIGDGDKLLMQYPETMTMDEVTSIWDRITYAFKGTDCAMVAVPSSISFHILHIESEE